MITGRFRGVRTGLVAGLAVFLGACSLEPFPVQPTAAVLDGVRAASPSHQQARIEVVSICYNRYSASESEVLAAAERSCPGGKLTLFQQDSFWNGCALFQPVRASFTCLSASRGGTAPGESATPGAPPDQPPE